MHRFFAQRLDPVCAVLPAEEENHALRVLRLNVGDSCQALTDGEIYAAVIAQTDPQVILRLGEKLPSPEPKVKVTLYQGIPKGDKFDWIVQKCTEAGVCRIVPVAFSRCVARWDGKDAEKKRVRYQRIAAEAAKQSGRAAAPRIESPLSADAMCARLTEHALALVPWEEHKRGGLRAAWQGQEDVALVIGPEGGISPEEIGRMTEAGAIPVTLGKRIFRTETAGLAALISLLTWTGDME